MIIEEKKILVRDIFEGYFNDDEEGVVAYNDQLDIRPKYQREFVYKDQQRDEVIRTIMKGLPLNVMYWVDRGEEFENNPDVPRYEVLDGQQRTISICEFVEGNFSIDDRYFHIMQEDEREKILDYELFIYVCNGTDSEKLEWFKIINIAGEELTNQEMRNAVYAGSWTSDAKRYFSKSGCPAYTLAADYLKGSSIRQDYLETAIKWKADGEDKTIEAYMADHQRDENATELWNYFRDVIDWIETIFPVKRASYMNGLPWGVWYNKYKNAEFEPDKLEKRIQELLKDDYEVQSFKGIYEYLLTGNQKSLNLRTFDKKDKQWAYEKQNHKCPYCKKEFDFDQMHGDHIVPWSKGGKTDRKNLQMLCTECNIKKSNYDVDYSKWDNKEYKPFNLKEWDEK